MGHPVLAAKNVEMGLTKVLYYIGHLRFYKEVMVELAWSFKYDWHER